MSLYYYYALHYYSSSDSVNRFTVYPKPKPNRREIADFKVKSVLKGTEYECMAILMSETTLYVD